MSQEEQGQGTGITGRDDRTNREGTGSHCESVASVPKEVRRGHRGVTGQGMQRAQVS